MDRGKRLAIWVRATTSSTPPSFIASLGIPKTTQLDSSWAKVHQKPERQIVHHFGSGACDFSQLIIQNLNSPSKGINKSFRYHLFIHPGALYQI